MPAGSRLGFSGDNRTGIKEESESLQCVMLMLDPVRRRCNRFHFSQPLFFPPAVDVFHRVAVPFLSHPFSVALSLFISSLPSVWRC